MSESVASDVVTGRRQRLGPNIVAAEVDGGRIADNIVAFARLLRASGIPVGTDRVALAAEAVMAAGIEDPRTLYWTLHASLIRRRADKPLFDQAFMMFWKDPDFLSQLLSLMLPQYRPAEGEAPTAPELSRRLAESLFKSRATEAPKADETVEVEARGTFSQASVSRTRDFEQMSAAELADARRVLRNLAAAFPEIRTRRLDSTRGKRGERLDVRAMLRDMAAVGGDGITPRFRQRRWRQPPLVVLCDISGSMDTYARTFLHFLYGLANARQRVDVFLFATGLHNVSRELRNRDPDAAMAKVGRSVTDWAGGTRIGAALGTFNRRWARRVLGQNATVLLFTDGLDREGGDVLEAEARRLRASCRRLVWLNPLMRFDRYAPLAAGAATLARHASERRPCHNIDSLGGIAAALSAPPGREETRR